MRTASGIRRRLRLRRSAAACASRTPSGVSHGSDSTRASGCVGDPGSYRVGYGSANGTRGDWKRPRPHPPRNRSGSALSRSPRRCMMRRLGM